MRRLRAFLRSGWPVGVASLAMGCAASTGAGPGGTCTMQEVGELGVLNDRGVPLVPVRVNGHDAIFVVDTGAAISTIDPTMAASLGLVSTGSGHFALGGVSGDVRAPVIPVHELSVGSMRAREVVFAGAGRFGLIDRRRVAGLFGADFLSNYDVEFDMPHHRIGLYVEQGFCGAGFDPWDEPAMSVSFRLNRSGQVEIPVRIGGAPVDAVLDSGAAVSVLDPSDARVAGASDAALASDRAVTTEDIAAMEVRSKLHRFPAVQVGSSPADPLAFAIVDTTDPLIGENWLRHHTVWISYPHDLVLEQESSIPAR